MPTPNQFMIYVRDAKVATEFYRTLFEMEPSFTSPRYVAFEVAPGVLFAVWTGGSRNVTTDPPRTSEVGLMVPGGGDAVDEIHQRWSDLGVTVLEPPHDDVFGRTFVVADPDGNLIRVAPVD